MSTPYQPLLPDALPRHVEIIDDEVGDIRKLLAWKRVRPTSAALYALMQDTGLLDIRRKRVLNAIAAIRNSTQRWPTACEITKYLHDRKVIPSTNPNIVLPRCTELSTGWEETREVNGSHVKVFVPCDILERGPKRKSDVSGHTCLTWMIREVGGDA